MTSTSVSKALLVYSLANSDKFDFSPEVALLPAPAGLPEPSLMPPCDAMLISF
ncbi:hypothetical protein [Candidatus Njordibacter sp. Uisw_058]|uniref:hypothetical protein n=1 Tax=Candidatus Njordibacter sp. Uisw_058 TaxID=3230974 RepID=UPI003D4CE639